MKLIKFLTLVWVLLSGMTLAVPPTPEDDKAIAGNWQVTNPFLTRIYEISEGRSLKLVGGKQPDKRAKLMPQDDGSYHADADGAILRIIYVKADDQILVSCYSSKQDLKKGLPPEWKTTGKRYQKP
jgi:hypothetical protein